MLSLDGVGRRRPQGGVAEGMERRDASGCRCPEAVDRTGHWRVPVAPRVPRTALPEEVGWAFGA
jgi:hypothetical protein